MPDVIGASRTSDIPRLGEMDRNASALFLADGGPYTIPAIKTLGIAPSVGSGGAGVSLLTMVAGSTNLAGGVNATLTGVAPGAVVGVVAFSAAQPTAPLFVICSLAAPTAGVAAPPVIGADTYTTAGFTIRNYGPTTVTTGAYVINYVAFF